MHRIEDKSTVHALSQDLHAWVHEHVRKLILQEMYSNEYVCINSDNAWIKRAVTFQYLIWINVQMNNLLVKLFHKLLPLKSGCWNWGKAEAAGPLESCLLLEIQTSWFKNSTNVWWKTLRHRNHRKENTRWDEIRGPMFCIFIYDTSTNSYLSLRCKPINIIYKINYICGKFLIILNLQNAYLQIPTKFYWRWIGKHKTQHTAIKSTYASTIVNPLEPALILQIGWFSAVIVISVGSSNRPRTFMPGSGVGSLLTVDTLTSSCLKIRQMNYKQPFYWYDQKGVLN